MAAPTHKPPLLLLLLASACASTQPEPAESFEPRPAAAGRMQTPSVAPALDEEFAELEGSLEAYEQQLASNEARLRAMGVLVAVRDSASLEAEAQSTLSRFAPPPPARADTPTVSSSRPADDNKDARAEKAKKSAKKPSPQPSAPSSAPGGGAGATSASPPAPRNDANRVADAAKRAESKPDADRGRCAELCDLADSTCDLEGKICDLAARHPGDARYAEVCRRADEDCRVAAEACTLCSP
jgi:hypothetical protein